MAATITRYSTAPTFQVTDVTYIKDIMTSLGIATSAIVYETSTEAIYKITQGTGTYADTYIRFYVGTAFFPQPGISSTTWLIQVGTGFESNALTGAGSPAAYSGVATSTGYGGATSATYFTTIVSSDGSWRQLMTFNASYVYTGGFAIVRTTNTALTANDAPLTYVSAASGSLNAGTENVHRYVRSQSNAQYGPLTSSSLVAVNASVSSQFGLTTGKAGTYGALPNVPILSGGWPIGYNTNLAYVSSGFLVMDRVVVTQGSEEYMVIDPNTGLAIREV